MADGDEQEQHGRQHGQLLARCLAEQPRLATELARQVVEDQHDHTEGHHHGDQPAVRQAHRG